MSVCKCVFHRNHSKLFIEITEDKESTKDKNLKHGASATSLCDIFYFSCREQDIE